MHPCRDFAQRSIPSLFSSSKFDDCSAADSPVSLVDFLDKKLGNFKEHEKSEGPKVNRFSLFHQSENSEDELPMQKSFTNNNRVIDHLLSQRASKKRDFETDGNALSSKLLVSSVDSQYEGMTVSPKQVDARSGTKRNPKSAIQTLKRRKRLPGRVQGSNSSRHTLVLGDDPINRSNFGRQRVRETVDTNFNHYADGGGWWDEDMVGVDQALGSVCEWEGVGTTSLGTSLGPTL